MKWKYQRGAALLISLVILIVLSIIGLSAVRGGLLQTLLSANAQQAEMAFSAADAGVAAVIQTAKVEGDDDAGILAAALTGAVVRNVNENGEATADAANLDDNRNTPIHSASTTTNWTACVPVQCPGFSIKAGGPTGCHSYRIDSTGAAGNTSTQVSQWVSVVAAPC